MAPAGWKKEAVARRKSSDSSTVTLYLFPARVVRGDSRWSGVSFAGVLGGDREIQK